MNLIDPPGSSTMSLVPRFRYRLFYIWAMLWGALMTVIAAIGYITAQLIARDRSVFRWWSKFWARSILSGLGVHVDCRQLEDLDCSRSYVFVCNHQIMMDILLTAVAVPCSFGFVAKAELERVPFLGWAIRSSPSVFVDRSHPRRSFESIRRAASHIRRGTSVIIFPEGERTFRREMKPFMKGAFLLALEAGVPLVPVTIIDAVDVFSERTHLARPGTVRVIVGKAIRIEGMSRRELPGLMDRVRLEIERHLDSDDR